ncbi:MAG: hypothetical protein NVS1B2_16200 [Vulcanimicrobiaceae bacterium]
MTNADKNPCPARSLDGYACTRMRHADPRHESRTDWGDPAPVRWTDGICENALAQDAADGDEEARAILGEPLLGTVCHNGHEMQATLKAYVSLTPEGEGVADDPRPCAGGPDFDVYCAEDCEAIPDAILGAAFDLFAKAYPA